MTPLSRQALASLPLDEKTIESIYDSTNPGVTGRRLKILCASHERLRIEAAGAESLWQDERKKVEGLEAENARLKAQNDEIKIENSLLRDKILWLASDNDRSDMA